MNRTTKKPHHSVGVALASLNVRIPAEELLRLQELARERGTSLSEQVREAIASAHDPRLEGLEWDATNGQLILTLRFVDGYCLAAAFDIDQAREIADHLAAALELAQETA